MSVLFLGGTGFLGKEVSNLFLRKDIRKIDLSKIKLISNILKKKPDTIINCAVVANFKSNYSKKC